MKRHSCYARQYSDEMVCHRCGLRWDINDPEPPECQKQPIKRRVRSFALKNNQLLNRHHKD